MIRPLEEKDIDWALEIGQSFCKLAGREYNKEALRSSLLSLVDSGIVLRSDNGVIGGMIYPLYMSGEVVAQEFFWWSTGRDGKDLLDEFEKEAKAQGAKYTIMISLHNYYQPKIDQIYLDKGYTELEKSFIKEV